jgi:hypothetical protein
LGEKNRSERQQWWLRSAAVLEYGEHRKPAVQRAVGFSTPKILVLGFFLFFGESM